MLVVRRALVYCLSIIFIYVFYLGYNEYRSFKRMFKENLNQIELLKIEVSSLSVMVTNTITITNTVVKYRYRIKTNEIILVDTNGLQRLINSGLKNDNNIK